MQELRDAEQSERAGNDPAADAVDAGAAPDVDGGDEEGEADHHAAHTGPEHEADGIARRVGRVDQGEPGAADGGDEEEGVALGAAERAHAHEVARSDQEPHDAEVARGAGDHRRAEAECALDGQAVREADSRGSAEECHEESGPTSAQSRRKVRRYSR